MQRRSQRAIGNPNTPNPHKSYQSMVAGMDDTIKPHIIAKGKGKYRGGGRCGGGVSSPPRGGHGRRWECFRERWAREGTATRERARRRRSEEGRRVARPPAPVTGSCATRARGDDWTEEGVMPRPHSQSQAMMRWVAMRAQRQPVSAGLPRPGFPLSLFLSLLLPPRPRNGEVPGQHRCSSQHLL